MTKSQAKRLSKNLRRGNCSAKVSKNQIVFCGPSGEHSLDLRVSSLERVLSHWRGFCLNNGCKPFEPRRGSLVAYIEGNGRLLLTRIDRRGERRPRRGLRAGERVAVYWLRRLYDDGSLAKTDTHSICVDNVAECLL